MSGGDLTADSPRAHAARLQLETALDAEVAEAGVVDARAGRSLDLLNLFVANIQRSAAVVSILASAELKLRNPPEGICVRFEIVDELAGRVPGLERFLLRAYVFGGQ